MRQPFQGNITANVNRDAKYSIKRNSGEWAVQLVYRGSHDERALLATQDHRDLVRMVNALKEEVTGEPGGAFYINEYKQVIVPAGGACYCAGYYGELLAFDFEGTTISPKPESRLAVGDIWIGPRVGLQYVLAAGASDIKFARNCGNLVVTEFLSLHTSGRDATRLALRLARTKGLEGGRIYINEARQFFAPIQTTTGLEYRYLGPLSDDPWFHPVRGDNGGQADEQSGGGSSFAAIERLLDLLDVPPL